MEEFIGKSGNGLQAAGGLDALESGLTLYHYYFVTKWRRSLKIKQSLFPDHYRLDDWFRLSVHAVITDAEGAVLLLKATYDDQAWGLPGGALDPGETIHEGLRRECREDQDCDTLTFRFNWTWQGKMLDCLQRIVYKHNSILDQTTAQ
jgi:hypothetical protein